MPAPSAPRFGDTIPMPDGVPLRAVTFRRPTAPTPGAETMLQLIGVTDPGAIDAMLLRPDGVDGASLTLHLPDDLVAGYGFVTAEHIPRDAADDFFAWIAVLQSARPDPAVAERIPDQLGGTASVLRMPGSRRHPAELPDAASLRRYVRTPIDLGADGVATVLVPDSAPGAGAVRVLVLFDAENWAQLPLADDLSRHPLGDTAVLLMPSGDPYRRFATLPDRAAVADWTRRALAGAQDAGAFGETPVAAITAAGQSYGALAAVGLVLDGIAGAAIAQSGSFEQRADTTAGEEGDRPGDLIEALATTPLPQARFVVQHGSLEPVASCVAPLFAAAARDAGAAVLEREYRGGHDYAWWRTGLLDGLDALEELRGLPPVSHASA
ncbi:enterochelin esterase domain-containing protein [Microbacterium telephonicum]|uniref:Enterochelin esterase family protein n=1 Tax=Microbacterium telephonicum TaxID=1714841 RepID=A0A498BWQ1_9MICO|nr:enterochelin esterase domain-containing protein [Microbacterium telephonicum]RLK47895.1 enterochelin esterase family protein [Microbacterium telephonicum]